jgi:hypothetical protein
MSTRNIPGRLKHCWQVRVTTSLPSVSWLSRKCGIFDVFTNAWALQIGITSNISSPNGYYCKFLLRQQTT